MRVLTSFTVLLLLAAYATAADRTELAEQVRAAERSFAATMAARDHAAFSKHLAEDAVFFAGDKALHGKAAVAAGWKAFFEPLDPPFSWAPESVEVLESGNLAHSSGPVFNAQGKRIAEFNSIWRREPDGEWRVVFDKGCAACNCAADGAG
jgi:ketosteroid isomerase-like protein